MVKSPRTDPYPSYRDNQVRELIIGLTHISRQLDDVVTLLKQIAVGQGLTLNEVTDLNTNTPRLDRKWRERETAWRQSTAP